MSAFWQCFVPLFVAVDAVGAGCGETVMIIRDGQFAREWLQTDASPVRWIIVGIKD